MLTSLAPLLEDGSMADFVEVGDSVLMSVALPELLSTRDRDARGGLGNRLQG